MLDALKIKQDFPIFQSNINEKPLIFLDNASTTQKPKAVLDAMTHYYTTSNANIHRGIYTLSERASNLYEKSRKKVKHFIHAKHAHEIIFTRGTTEAINLVAQSYARPNLKADDHIIITEMEHHSNILPWQNICEQTGAVLKIIPVTNQGELDLAIYEKMLSEKTKLVALSHISNVLGTINPIKKMTSMAHQYNVPVLIDGAQAISHMPVDVQNIDCDFYVFSGHKMYAPTGIGVLYGKEDLLNKMPPYQLGGGMIEQVSFDKTTYAPLPAKFEAGTPDIAGTIGLATAIDYLNSFGLDNIKQHEHSLLIQATNALQNISGLNIIGEASKKSAVISFVLNNIHAHDIATILNTEGISVRAGHHCAMPLMKRFNVPATTRISFGVYNTVDDIEKCIAAFEKIHEVFA